MSTHAKQCPDCRRPIEPEWRACPFCGFQLTAVEVEFLKPAGKGGADPHGAEPPGAEPPLASWSPQDMPPRREARTDLVLVGGGLAVVGGLGFIGIVTAFLNGFDLGPNALLWGGASLVLIMVVGTVLFGASTGTTEGGVIGGLIGGVLAGIAGICMAVVLVVATFVYLIADCFRALSGS